MIITHIKWVTSFALKISPALHNLQFESVHEFLPTRIQEAIKYCRLLDVWEFPLGTKPY